MFNKYDFKNYVWQYFLPYICLLAFLFNIINITVFVSLKLKKKNPIYYNYFLGHSVFECLYALLSFAHFFVKHVLKIPHCTYLVNFIEHYFFNLATTSIAIFLIFIEILIALNRLLVIFYSKIAFKIHFSLKLMTFFCTLSAISQYPVFKSRSIMRLHSNYSACHQNESYTIHENDFIRTKAYTIVFFLTTYFRGILVPLILLTINIIICIKFRKQIKKKISLTRSLSSNSFYFLVFFLSFNLYISVFSAERDKITSQSTSNNKSQSKSQPIQVKTIVKRRRYRKALKASRRITMMVILMGFVHLLANFLTSSVRQLTAVFGSNFEFRIHLLIASNIILYASHSMDILFYYYFDNQYRTRLKQLILSVLKRK